MQTGRYVIRGGVEGRERLRILSEVMWPSTRDLLDEVTVPASSNCLDVGCGGGDVTIELARIVGPTGRVIGVDLDETKLTIARQEADEHGLSNIMFEVQDVTRWQPQPREQFDFVYARFLLTHLSDPGAMVSTLRRHLRPGGMVILEDIDFRGHFAEPECPALLRYVEWYTRSVQRRGGDPNIGPRLPGLLLQAGFKDVRMNLVHPVSLKGGIKLLTCVTLENIADAVLQDELATKDELDQTIEELYGFARNSHTVLGGPRVFQVWGRNTEPG